MELFRPLVFDLLKILTDTFKIYLKNVRLMVFIAALIISLYTMLYLFNHFFVKPLIPDVAAKKSYLLLATPGSPEFTNLSNGMLNDVNIYVGLEWVYWLISAIAFLFFTVLTTHASALIHASKEISIKDLVLKTVRSLKRPFITCFYINLFGLGYIVLYLAIMIPLVLIMGSRVTSSVFAILLSIIVVVFYAYLSVVWNVSFVISVLEEKVGIEALGKAAQIVKGMKLQGFVLNLLFTVLQVILYHFLRFNLYSIRMVISLLLLNSIWMVPGAYGGTAYTVFYYQCKKNHGEEIELQADVKYNKIPTAPLLNGNSP